jgi:Spy/CpxP family protein refolding chaperone
MTGQIKLHCWTSVALVALIALVALATLDSGGMVQAALAAGPDSATIPIEWNLGGSEALMHGREVALFQALHQLNLSDTQKQQVRAISDNARTRRQSQSGFESSDKLALDDPGNPNHVAAVAAAKVRAAQHIQDWSDAQQRIYAVLTPDQQAQLPQVLSDLQRRYSKQGQPVPAASTSGS